MDVKLVAHIERGT